MKRHHVLITGTGRSGTSFLMELLTELGLDTGVGRRAFGYSETARAGYEDNLRSKTAPYIVKKPQHSTELDEILHDHDVVLDHLLLPIRDLADAAASRIRLSESAEVLKANQVAGGLFDTDVPEDQERVLRYKLSELMVAIARHDIPHTILYYPRLVTDEAYLYPKLKPVFDEIERDAFTRAFARVSKPPSR